MDRRALLQGLIAAPLLAAPAWAQSRRSPSVYADGRFFPVLSADRETRIIVLAEPLRGHAVFKADRPWDDKLDKVNLTPLR